MIKQYLIKLLAVSLLLNQFSGYGLLVQAQLSENNQETEIVEEENQAESDPLENELDNSLTKEDLLEDENQIENDLSDIESDENVIQEDLEKEDNEVENNSSQNELDESLIQEDSSKEEVELEQSTPMVDENSTLLITETEEVESRGIASGLVQLWQVVPGGQTSEGKTTAQIMSSLQCRPNHNLYANNGKTEHATYVNSCYVDDALYLGEDSNYYYIYLSGFEGKVPKSQSHYYELDLNKDGKKVKYEIQTVAYYIPASQVKSKNSDSIHTQAPVLNYETDYLKQYTDFSEQESNSRSSATVQSPSYYANDNGVLVHYLTNNVKVANNYSKVIIGKAPSWMESGRKYYSYDGIYFYTNWQSIRVNGSGAVNQNNPFYNYYQYLPFRSTTSYDTTILDNYTTSNGYTEFPTTTTLSSKQSMLVGAGKYFINAQKNFGTNAALQYAMGIHESGWGRSSISVTKNNLFGMNATDSNPYGDATTFYSVEDGIFYHADRYISWGYTDPVGDYRYFGSHVGNKGSGMNVKYASDPFWGEKIAGWYYRLDSASGLKDYNYYSLGIKQSNEVYNVHSEANTLSTVLYTTKNAKNNIKLINYPVLLVGEEGNFYQVKTDTPIVNNKPVYSATYKWDENYAYVSKDAIYVANDASYNDPQLNVSEIKTFDTFTVSSISADSEKLTGTGLSGATVKAYVNNKEVGSTKVGADGKYSLTLSAKQKGGTEIVVKMSMSGYQTISKTQKVLHVFDTFTIGTITKDTTKFTGTGLSGATVKAYVNNKEVGSAKVGTDGKYSLTLSAKQKGGTEIVVKMSMSGYQTISKTQKVLHVFDKFTVGSITTNTTKFTGTGLSGATVKAYVNNKEIGSTKVGTDGKYSLSLSAKQKGGTEVVVKMNMSGYQTISKTQKVLHVFNTFTIGTITTNTTKFTGTGLSGATVKAYVNNKEVGSTKVGTDGKYSLTLSAKQKGGTEIVVKMSKSGYQTISKTQKVLHVFDKFTVGSITTNTTKFTGMGLSGATVKAYINNKEVAKATVGSNGKYTLTLSKKQKAGTEIVVKMSKSGYQTISKTQKVLKVFDKFTVGSVATNTTKFTGTGLSGATVKAYINNKEVAKATVGSNGKYTLTLSKKQKAGTEIVVKMSKSGYQTISKTQKVVKVFSTFTVNKIKSTSVKFTGTGLSGATVKAYINNKEVAKATVGSSGKYTLTLSKKQKAGTEIVVKMSKSGYKTISKTVKVIKG